MCKLDIYFFQAIEFETSFIENPHACETSPMILPVNNLNRANWTLGYRKNHKRNKIKLNALENMTPAPDDLPSPEDPWVPQKPIFRREDDDEFQEKVKFVHKYVSRLSSFLQKMEKEQVTVEEWRALAKIVNRFFMVMTVIGFSVTALLFYLFTSPKE